MIDTVYLWALPDPFLVERHKWWACAQMEPYYLQKLIFHRACNTENSQMDSCIQEISEPSVLGMASSERGFKLSELLTGLFSLRSRKCMNSLSLLEKKPRQIKRHSCCPFLDGVFSLEESFMVYPLLQGNK